jgi:predicted CXXCH cytochrome family protein
MKTCSLLLVCFALVAMMVMPAAGQNYTGVSSCSGCHSNVGAGRTQYTQWSKTLHAHAYDSIPAVQGLTACAPCHTTGWDTTLANKGADDYVTRNGDGTFTITDATNFNKKKNVQCEDCHGPVQIGSTAPANHPSSGPVAGSLQFPQAETCGKCHDGDMDPYLTEWKTSAHAMSDSNASPFLQNMFRSDSNCSACHTYQGFRQFVKDTTGIIPHVNPPGATAALQLVCVACHDPHSTTNAAQLRIPAEQLCQKCHNPEYDANTPTPGTEVHNSTAYMLEGIGGYQYADYTYESSPHKDVTDKKCVTCHVVATPFVSAQKPASTGHNFMPKGTKCFECHGDFDTLSTSFNYHHVQTEIDSLAAVLNAKLTASGSADSITDGFKRAKFDYDFVTSDGSHGVHNYMYAKGLLLSAITNYTPTGLGVIPVKGQAPVKFALSQNYPNPFNPSTTITFALPTRQNVHLRIYDVVGNLVTTLISQELGAGSYNVTWNGTNSNGLQITSGIYLYKIDAGPYSMTRKMIFMK